MCSSDLTFGELCRDSDAVTLKNDAPSAFEESGNVRGRPLVLEVRKSPFRDDRGSLIGTVGSARDITERQRIAHELEQHRHRLEELVEQRTAELLATEARAAHILESSADGLYGVDTSGNISFINPAACAMLGYGREQVIGRNAHDLFHHSRQDGSCYPREECPGHSALLAGQIGRAHV